MTELLSILHKAPDLNIMEDLWSYLDRKVKAAKIMTIQGLKRKQTHEGEPPLVRDQQVRELNAGEADRVCAAGGRAHPLLRFLQ